MVWQFDERFDVLTDDGHVTVYRAPAPGRPTALLVHGTGHCAAIWAGVAEGLAQEFDVVALDRRGHGRSTATTGAYDFTDFAHDIAFVVEALGIEDAYGVGHSAGGTDLLLSAADRPGAFRRLFVIEPTAMDPGEPNVRADMRPEHEFALEQYGRRRSNFPSRSAVLERYTGRGFFEGWRPDLLDAYVREGFRDTGDGSVELRCTPAAEIEMLMSIFEAMESSYRVGVEPHPFDALGRVRPPILIATTENSQPIYKAMADVVERLVPNASRVRFDGLGHAAAQVDPQRVAAEVLRFWQATDRHGGMR